MPAEKMEILVRLNGPYRITGSVKVVDADGKEFDLPAEVFALCRCGRSENKPFCDGTHKKIEFQAETRSPVGPHPRSPQEVTRSGLILIAGRPNRIARYCS